MRQANDQPFYNSMDWTIDKDEETIGLEAVEKPLEGDVWAYSIGRHTELRFVLSGHSAKLSFRLRYAK